MAFDRNAGLWWRVFYCISFYSDVFGEIVGRLRV